MIDRPGYTSDRLSVCECIRTSSPFFPREILRIRVNSASRPGKPPLEKKMAFFLSFGGNPGLTVRICTDRNALAGEPLAPHLIRFLLLIS